MGGNSKNKRHGFTIIEVLIVLAIAGLIMIIVFMAVPTLKRNGRNNARRHDIGSIKAVLTEYMANNSGQLPNLSSDITDLIKFSYYEARNIRLITGETGTVADVEKVYIVKNSFCQLDGTQALASNGSIYTGPTNNKTVMVVYTLETNASIAGFCEQAI